MSFIEWMGLFLFIILGGVVIWRGLIWYRDRFQLQREIDLATPHEIEVNGFRVHYIQGGKGDPLILFHGIGASIYCWRKIYFELTKHFHVIAVDIPGFGRSSKNLQSAYDLDTQTERLLKVIQSLKLSSKVTLIGSSMGGTLALWLAKRHPELVSQVVALAPATNPKLVPFELHRLSWMSRWLRIGLNKKTMSEILKRIFVKHDEIDDTVIENYLKPYKEEPKAIQTFVKSIATLRDPRLPKDLETIQCPVLLLYGRQDRMVPAKYMKELHSLIKNSSYHEIDGGHHVMEDQPDWTVKRIIEFINDQGLAKHPAKGPSRTSSKY